MCNYFLIIREFRYQHTSFASHLCDVFSFRIFKSILVGVWISYDLVNWKNYHNYVVLQSINFLSIPLPYMLQSRINSGNPQTISELCISVSSSFCTAQNAVSTNGGARKGFSLTHRSAELFLRLRKMPRKKRLVCNVSHVQFVDWFYSPNQKIS